MLAIIATVVIAIVVAIVLGIVGYKLRTGEWFKLKHKDEETLAVDFEKAWLMEEEPGRRKRNSVKVVKSRHVHVLHTESQLLGSHIINYSKYMYMTVSAKLKGEHMSLGLEIRGYLTLCTKQCSSLSFLRV